jgi:hypothetical protein
LHVARKLKVVGVHVVEGVISQELPFEPGRFIIKKKAKGTNRDSTVP